MRGGVNESKTPHTATRVCKEVMFFFIVWTGELQWDKSLMVVRGLMDSSRCGKRATPLVLIPLSRVFCCQSCLFFFPAGRPPRRLTGCLFFVTRFRKQSARHISSKHFVCFASFPDITARVSIIWGSTAVECGVCVSPLCVCVCQHPVAVSGLLQSSPNRSCTRSEYGMWSTAGKKR